MTGFRFNEMRNPYPQQRTDELLNECIVTSSPMSFAIFSSTITVRIFIGSLRK